MRVWVKLILLSVILAGWIQPRLAAKFSGTVKSNDGTPFANVAIYVGSDFPETKTNSDGLFTFATTIKKPVIFISHAGYRPAVRVIGSAGEQVHIELEPEASSTWWVTTCSYERPVGKVIGPFDGLRINLPKGVRYQTRPGDIDYVIGTIEFGIWNPQQLEFWIGPSASGPRPPSDLIEESREIKLRYWRSVDKAREGVDARGSDVKGRQWRHVNIGSTGIMYRQASAAAAKFFDGIIDSMCIQ